MKAVFISAYQAFYQDIWTVQSAEIVDLLIGMKYKEGVILMVTPTMAHMPGRHSIVLF